MSDILLKQALEALETIALRAYWTNRLDCGSDYDPEYCIECEHHDICKAHWEFKHYLSDLEDKEAQEHEERRAYVQHVNVT